MESKYIELIKSRCSQENFNKLTALNNAELFNFIGEYVQLCQPKSVFVRTDALADAQYIREKAKQLGEEAPLAIAGHTVHFDGPFDQARDKENTRFLVSAGLDLGAVINSIDRKKGIKEINSLLKNIMQGREMLVLLLCLGPVDSDFSIYAVQLTDSCYVAHAEDILFRPAYQVFKKQGRKIEFFKYVHSAGKLEHKVSKNVAQRRIYIDVGPNLVYSLNAQYAGNTVGLKKLSLRLAIRKASAEGWLAEHMFVMQVLGPNRRQSNFCGAFPSFCGKTSTCMVQGEKIIGDDIAYLRKRAGRVFAVNVERGIFGIVKDVNPQDDPLIWQVLNSPGEIIFSNVLMEDAHVFWHGDGRQHPDIGQTIFPHSNARYNIRLKGLKNCAPELEDPNGSEIKGIIYGGRDSDTWPPVFESFSWAHGTVTIAAALESETTAATLGQQGVRRFNPMANLDFLSIPLGKYIQNHLDFARDLAKPPKIFGVNYFLKDKDGNYLTGMQDKRVWLKWMELRVHNDVEAIKTAIGLLPKYADLQRLFKELLNKDYTKDEYQRQFSLRTAENIAKMERIIDIYTTKVTDAPNILFKLLKEQKNRLG